jgi:hypothetical protein
MYSSGALTLGNNNLTTFNKIFARKQTPHFSIFGSTTLGITQPGTPYTSSLFQNTSNIISRSFVIGIEKPILGGNLELTYSQPLSIISGTTQLNQHNLSLTSSYQEQDLGLCFSKTNKTSSLSIQALYIQNRYNINNSNTFGGILTYKKHFK